MPARKRKADTDQGPHARAVSAVKLAYQRIAVTKMRRRPIRSASRPKTTLPTSEPASAEAAIQPARLPEIPQRAVKTGTVKPTSRISIATKRPREAGDRDRAAVEAGEAAAAKDVLDVRASGDGGCWCLDDCHLR